MTATTVLKATLRDAGGKGAARRLRRDGQIPAIMYGVDAPLSLALSERAFVRLLGTGGGEHGLVNLEVEGVGAKGVLIRDLQVDGVTGRPLHCDLLEVRKDHKVRVNVAVHIVGDTPVGVREQGILQQQLHEVEVDCLPGAIPEALEVDGSALALGDSLHVSDLVVPAGVQIHNAPEDTLCTVVPPRVQTDDVVTEEAGEAEEDTKD